MPRNCPHISLRAVLPMGLIFLCMGNNCNAKIADTTYQISTNAFRGQQHAQILKFKLVITALAQGKTEKATKFYFSTKGTTKVSDISAAHLYYTGNVDLTGKELISSDTIGAPVANPNGKMYFQVNKSLLSGNNYFFLAYDVSTNANISPDVLDATIDSVKLSDTSFTVKTGNPAGARAIDYYENYCNISVLIPNTASKQYIGITSVQIGTQINNPSGDLDRLTLYPAQKLTAYRQQTYPVAIKYGNGHNEQIIGWVDWNNDGIIDTSTETVFYTRSSASTQTFFTNISVPCTATPGAHKLRIESDIDTVPKLTPCSNLKYGDAEEYIIDVQQDAFPMTTTFAIDSPRYLGSPVMFTNTSNAQGNVKCEWCFSNNCLNNNSAKYDAAGDTAFYTWTQSPGKGSVTYAVKMRLTWQGCDSTIIRYVTDSVKLIPPAFSPVAQFMASQNVADTTTIIQLLDQSANKPGSWYWQIEPSVINGSPTFSYLNGTTYSSQNPVIKFNQTGNYNVSLTAHNGKGLETETKNGFFKIVNYVRMCGGIDTVTGNSGFIYDDGGKYGTYGNNKSCFVVIKPPCASAIKISFNSFDVNTYGAGKDNLKIYDSTNSKGKSLTASAGFPNGFQNRNPGNIPQNPPDITANSGTAFLQWTTDSSFTGDGFEAFWTSVLRTSAPPKAAFACPDTLYINHPVAFTNNSSGPELHFFWDLNGDGINDNFTSDPIFKYDSAGIVKVRLIAQNCGGVDTFYKTIVVLKNDRKPVVNFKTLLSDGITNITTVGTNEPIRFYDISSGHPYQWLWKIKPLNNRNIIRFINSDSLTQNPVVQFPDSGIYSVSLSATNEKGTSTTYRDSFIYVQQYCTPVVITPVNAIGISRIVLTDRNNDTLINHYSSCGDTGYNAYLTSNPPQLIQDDLYHINISRDTAIGNMIGMVWLNYSKDGNFNQADDTVLIVQNITGKMWSGSFPLRRIATGACRIRVGVNLADRTIDACGVNIVGQFEDFNVVLVKDTVPPVITLRGQDTVLVEEKTPYSDAGATVYDHADGYINYNLVTIDSVNTNKPGIYFVTYNAADNEGNAAKEVVRVVKVIGDTTAPMIILNDSQTVFVEVYTPYHEFGAVAKDNIDSALSVIISGTVNINRTGIYFITYSATDLSGNKGVAHREVIVGDTIKPVITLLGNTTENLQVLTHFADPGVAAADNYTRHLIYSINPRLDSSKIGIQYITYTATDSAGNSASVTRKVIVKNFIAPTIHFPFDTFYVDVNKNYTLPKPIMADNYYPVSKLHDTICYRYDKNTQQYIFPNKYKLGQTTVMFLAKDPAGLRSDTAFLIVKVVDRIAPDLYFNVDTMVYLKRWQYYDPNLGYYYSDNYDCCPYILTSGTFVNTDNPGTYYLNYQAEDHSGNKSKVFTRWFIVAESYSGIEAPGSSAVGFDFFPNPAKDKITINYSMPKASYISLNIKDMLGRNVKDIYGGFTPSIHLEKDISDLPAGMYYINFIRDGKQNSFKLVIEK